MAGNRLHGRQRRKWIDRAKDYDRGRISRDEENALVHDRSHGECLRVKGVRRMKANVSFSIVPGNWGHVL